MDHPEKIKSSENKVTTFLPYNCILSYEGHHTGVQYKCPLDSSDYYMSLRFLEVYI